ncbi:metalloregulator ArsR/SmtB family transcription factor [Sphingomonas sp. LB-2]|uniref:ArsR/SmtB family transcription factor n=1 Tax=Sphingomonas caeni TaxID=2984949 RepID=UPI002231D469|nr:metalloregulator ArsR/SmtB family transcription factor [Sphingomonas caeni]MCW3847804.1 metalloregulator ArsR/SmtB family transcription factor [Sphingomonas caeni]
MAAAPAISPPIDRVFHALGDPSRRAIVERLARGPLSVSRLAEPLGITVTAVGQHLRLLESCGLVASEKHGRTRVCRIEAAGLITIAQWIAHCRELWETRLDRLGDVLGEE